VRSLPATSITCEIRFNSFAPTEVYEKGDSPVKKKQRRVQRRVQRSDVQPPRVVQVSEEDVRLMISFRAEFERVGQ
jgi:hypothetical protein